jgi:putative hydrolase of the HAD superfamily
MSFKANKVDVSKEFCHILYLHYSSADAYKLHSDVKTCLERLFSAGVTMGVASDFDVRLQGILEGLGIDSYFQFVIQSLVEGYSKPSKELWEAAVQKAGSVDEGYHVGDDPKKDAFADAEIIILDREYNITTDFTTISSLEELPNILNI